MSKLVFLGDENHSIVDEWMTESKNSVQQVNMVSNGPSTDVKSGLGFSESSKKSTKPVDKFAQAMEKKNKNNNKRSRDHEEGEYEATHGLVEDMEESRTAIGSFVKKSVMKEQKKQKAIAEAKVVAETKTTPIANSSAVVAVPDFNGEIKPKRVKTRSKQKNIRRDNRAADLKPTHLQVGSKEYAGRPLTQETKKILGISKPQNNNNNNNNNRNNNQNRNKNHNKGNSGPQHGNSQPTQKMM